VTAPPTPHHGDSPTTRSPSTRWWGVAALLLALGWTALLHHGLGHAPGGAPTAWWHPTRFLLDFQAMGGLRDAPLMGASLLALPALLLAGVAVAGVGAAAARTAALWAPVACWLFAFYGLGASRVWEFFHWRGSLVLAAVALCVAATAASPWWAARWLESRRPALGGAVYAVVFLTVVALLRHVTGTDEALAFNFSPWPAIPIFGLEMAAYTGVGLLFGLALSAGSAARLQREPWTAALGFAAALALPAAWLTLRFGSLPPASGPLLGAHAVGLVGAAVARGPGRGPRLERRALHLALGAALVFLPLFTGRALSTGDYTATRFVRAQDIIEGLDAYYRAQEEYPEELRTLVEQGYLQRIPRPRVGFSWAYDLGLAEPVRFHYQNLGSSYVLEFVFTEWVQCAYNPPWEDELEETENGSADAQEDLAELAEAWSCPEARPELW